MNDHRKISNNWIFNREFSFFWKNYSTILNSPNNKALEDYIKLTNASLSATIEAKKETLKALDQNYFQKKKEDDESQIEFEISDELIKFYEESLKFKKQKKEKEFQNKLSGADYYSHGEQINLDKQTITSDAPRERAGLKREEELKQLYGDRANIIHLTETSLQMKFDKNLDVYEPSYWPSFPLRIKFN